LALLMGCGGPTTAYLDEEADPPASPHHVQQPFSSLQATQLDFEMRGEAVAQGSVPTSQARSVIREQLRYTIGQLNGTNSVVRFHALQLFDVAGSPTADGNTLFRYRAKVPVAWGSKTNLPTSYRFIVPRNASPAGLEAFTARYRGSCVNSGAHDVTSASFWYWFRPLKSTCKLNAADVVQFTASAKPSPENTRGKYPEYHRVWEDNELTVLALFGKNIETSNSNSDAGIAAYNAMVASMKKLLANYSPRTTPSSVPSSPGVRLPDITFTATMPGNLRIKVTLLLVDSVRSASAEFNARYQALSKEADLIAYNGHAGLGDNVDALAEMGEFVARKYLLMFVNGCDTYAYLNDSLAMRRARVNPDDPTGTKYMDVMTNAMPSYFHQNARATTAVMSALMRKDQPKTYEQIFAGIDPKQVVIVTGEEDNVFVPGYVAPTPYEWKHSGVVGYGEEQLFQTEPLAAGSYRVNLTEDPARPGGDADLMVRVGATPTLASFDCRPNKADSFESCTLELTAPAAIHMSVSGFANQPSAFMLSVTRDQ
jgi:hypothetical protein